MKSTRMRNNFYLLFSSFLIFSFPFFSLPSMARAAKIENLAGTPIVGDVLLEKGEVVLTLLPGEAIQEEVSVINRSGKRIDFQVVGEDVSVGRGYVPGLVFSDVAQDPYSLLPFIGLEDSSFSLNHGQRASIPFNIRVPAGIRTGGLYGAITFITSVSDEPSALSARLSSLIFLTVKGNARPAGKIESFVVSRKVYFGKPAVFEIGFANGGNVILSPTGKIKFFGLIGGEDREIQSEKFHVMPESSRRQQYFTGNLSGGLYRAVAEFEAAGIAPTRAEIYFCILPSSATIVLMMAIAALLVGIFFLLAKTCRKKKLRQAK